MKRKSSIFKPFIYAFFVVLFFPLFLQCQIVAIKAKRVYTVSHGVIENAMIFIREGKIEDVGANLEIPWNAEVIDYNQKIIVPGLIEAHAARGYDLANETNPLTPFVTILDNIDSSHDAFKTALSDGVTTLNIMPGNNTILGGRGAIIKPVGLVVEDMLVVPDSGLKVSVSGSIAQTRMGVMAQLRRYFNETKEYMDEKDKGAKKEEEMVSTPGFFRSPEYVKYESVADLIKGRFKAFVYCQLPSDVIRAFELAEKYGYQSVYLLGPECYKAADFIAANKLKVILDPELFYFEKDPIREETKRIDVAGVFHEKGVDFALQSDPNRIQARSLFYQAMKAMSSGLISADEALKAITLVPAQILGIETLVGSIDKGKLANFVVLDKEPFMTSTKIEFVYLEGKVAYDRAKDEKLKELVSEKFIY